MFKISLSPGHGINTPGKRTPDGMHEWEFNSQVVKHMMNELADYENVSVLRLDDPTGKRDIPLKERSDRTNSWGANVHLDIHANAFGSGWNDAHGIETFVYKTSLNEAYALAKVVQAGLIKETGLSNRGVKTGDLHMLRETSMPAILCECGFMTNKHEASLLKSDAYRKKVALAIVEGLADYYKLKKKATPKPKPAPKPTTKKDGKLHKVQVGAFSDPKNAEKLAAELKKKGYKTYIVTE